MIPDLKAYDLIRSSRGSRHASQVFWAWPGRGRGVDTQMEDGEARAGCWGSEGRVACTALMQACRPGVKTGLSQQPLGEWGGQRETGGGQGGLAGSPSLRADGGGKCGLRAPRPALASSTSPASQGGSAMGLLVVPADQSEPAPPCYRKWPWYPGPWSLETFLGKVNHHCGSGANPWAQRHL